MNAIAAKLKNFLSAPQEVKASIAYTFAGIVRQGLSILTLPLFTRLLTTEQYGLANVYSSAMAIMIIFTSLQLPAGSLSTAMVKFEDDRNGYLSSVTGLCTLLTMVYFGVIFLFHSQLEALTKVPYLLQVVMGFEMLMSTVQGFWMGKQRFEFKYKSVVFITLGLAVLSIVLSLLAISSFENKGAARVIANAAVTVGSGIFFYTYILSKGHRLFSKRYWQFALHFNIPLIPYYLSQTVFNQSDRLMISNIRGTGDAAIYSVAYSLGMILVFVLNAIINSYNPWLFTNIKKGTISKCKPISLGLAVLFSSMLLCIIMLAPEAIRIMAPDAYYSAIYCVPPIVLSALLLFYCSLFDGLQFYYEKKHYLLISSIISAVLNIVLNALLIPVYGFVAAAYTTLASYISFALLEYYFLTRISRQYEISEAIYDTRGLLFVFLTLAGAAALFLFLYDHTAIRYGIIALMAVLLLVYRNQIITVTKGYFAQMKERNG